MSGAMAAALLSTSANAYEPGWYFGLSGAYSSIEDSDGKLNTSLTSTTPPTEEEIEECLLAGVPVLGPLLNGVVGGLGVQGCLLTLLGPGTVTPGTPGGSTTQRLPAAPARITFDGGYSIAGSLGYLFDGGFRPELSVAISENDIDVASVETTAGSGLISDDGKVRTLRVLANAWYDFDFGSSIVPYLGVGAGFQQADLDLDDAGLSGKASGLVYQAGAGVGFVLGDATTLSIDYRYIVGDDMEASGQSPTAPDGSFTSSKLESEYKSQTVGVSLRRSFGGTPTDSDGDGVPDRKDKCPNTPKGVTVYSDGCPVDTDGDGVPDYLDKCPGTPKGTAVDAKGCPADSDGDGVPDSLDKCPGTPRGVMVGPDGCPIDSDGDGIPDAYDKCPNTPKGVIVGPDGCPAADADGDGVPDFMDKCPETPKGVAVGPDGCPLDSDGDGIPDYLDECPRTPPGAKVLPNGCALTGDCRKPRPGEAVDANGCALDKNFILRGVKFEFDSDRLTEPAKLILNEVAETLKAYPTIKVDLEGHTDNVGTDAYNLGLSERRANSVKTYLAGRGIEAPRMNPVGYGESRPIDTNDTEEGREENRRVELKVIE